KIYMVHLPMEAKNFNAEEDLTLRVSDSDAKISRIVRDIKKTFPKVAYINNHTGSKFTSNELAMNRLIYALKKENINFIDSRTTADTKVPKVMKNFGLNYVARDVFLDHAMDKASIKKAIKKAIKIAKLHGTAIAIGHPHANTILALHESKKLFKDVELVYVNRLY
ncbi:MAG: divergent polysaccharide deacetylase family protein, partial [Campylobacterota bacterium]|nr:divergent polysaccharide deacetylase family protein [Campylobacterota bacterium]